MSKMQKEPALKLLIINDEEAQLELIQEHLKQCELQIFVATNSQVGLTIFKEQRPEIVLLDFAMPGVNGMDIYQ
jgi:two-component system phosphate regulon response regulator PhoB